MTQDLSFDVFLSYSSSDRPTVIKIAKRLRALDLRVWLDVWELQPGLRWQPELEKALKSSKAVAVVIGKDGLGPWEKEEMLASIDRSTREALPVIPVLIHGAPEKPDLPTFLSARAWVDLRRGLGKTGINRLVFGITGEKPGDQEPHETISLGIRPPVPHNLPLDSLGSLFHGRDRLLEQLARDLDVDPAGLAQNRAVLHGLGGIGKTRLAVEYAWRVGSRYTAVFFVTAESPAALRRGLADLATPSLMDLKLEGLAEVQIVEHVLSWLRENPGWLLILDNVDLEEAAVAVQQLLPRLDGHVLITSRLSPWPRMPERDVEKLEPEDAVQYLLDRTDGKRRSCPDDDDLAGRLAGAELLDGLPLAL